MNANSLRRLNWLWKNRHRHDGDDELTSRVTIIERQVEENAGGLVHSHDAQGAHIHLVRSTTQTIAVGGEAIEWTGPYGEIGRRNFDAHFSTTDIVVVKEGYYDIHFDMGWFDFEGGGSVWIEQERSDGVFTIWPPAEDPGLWTSDNGQFGSWVAPAIPCEPDDILRVFVDHQDASAQDLETAIVAVELVDRTGDAGLNYAYTYSEVGSVTGLVPANTEVGDLLLAFVYSANPTNTTPSGWTRQDSVLNSGSLDSTHILDWKVADSDDIGGAATWSGSGGSGLVDMGVLIVRIPQADVDTSSPFDATVDSDAPAQDTASISTSVTTATDGALLVMLAGSAHTDISTHTYSGGVTRRFQGGISGERISISYATETQATAGASGTKTMTASPTPTWIGGYLVPLKPA